MSERYNESYGPVTTHAEITDVIEKDDRRRALGIIWLAQQRAHDDVRTARLSDDACAPVVMLFAQIVEATGQRAGAKIRASGYDKARRFATGMRVDEVQGFHAVIVGIGARCVLVALGTFNADFSIVRLVPRRLFDRGVLRHSQEIRYAEIGI
jgi:hypothetical protein